MSKQVIPNPVPEELAIKKDSWKGISWALGNIFLGKEDEFFNNLLENRLSAYETNRNQTTTNAVSFFKDTATSIVSNISSITSILSFIIQNPKATVNLVELGKNPTIYLDKDFQREIIENENLWNKFLPTWIEKLPEIGKVLANSGVEIFKEGRVLDSVGLNLLKDALKNPNNLQVIKSIVLESLEPFPDFGKITKNTLGMLATDENFNKFFEVKGEAIKNYLQTINNTVTAGDVTRVMDKLSRVVKEDDLLRILPDKIKHNQVLYSEFVSKVLMNLDDPNIYSKETISRELMKTAQSQNITINNQELDKLIDASESLLKRFTLPEYKKMEAVKNNSAELIAIIINENASRDPVKEIMAQLNLRPEFKELNLKQQNKLELDLHKAVPLVTPLVREYLNLYRVAPELLNHIPALLNKMPEINSIYTSMQTKGLFEWVGESLEMFTNDPRLRQFIENNSDFIPNVAKGVIAATPFLQKTTQDFRFDGKILDILGYILVKPELAASMINSLNRGNYIELTQTLINTLNDREITGFKEELQRQASHGLFTNLIIGVIEQNEKALIASNGDLSTSLKSTMEKFGITTENINIIIGVFPILLNKPNELQKLFAQFQSGEYPEMARDILAMTATNPVMREYISKTENKAIFTNILSKVKETAFRSADLQSYQIGDEISQVFEILTKPETKQFMDPLLNNYKRGEWLDLAKNACRFMDESPEFKKYLLANEENFAKIIKIALDKVPAVKSYIGGKDIGELANKNLVHQLIKDPKGILKLIESFEKGNIALGKALITRSYNDPELRKAVVSAAKTAIPNLLYSFLPSMGDQQNIVTSIITELGKGSLEHMERRNVLDVVKNFEFTGGSDNPKNKILIELLDRNILFDRVSIRLGELVKLHNLEFSNMSFVNTTMSNITFENSIFKNVSFNDAVLLNVSFQGATIDAHTLGSMVDSVRKGEVYLHGAKIVGDLSSINLSGINLSGADLSEVTSLKNVNLEGANLENVIFPAANKLDFSEAFNIDKATFSEEVINAEIIAVQKETLIKMAVNTMATKSLIFAEPMSNDQKMELTNHIISLRGTIVGQYILKTLENNPEDIFNNNFSVKENKTNNIKDYKDKTSSMLTTIFQNRNSLQDIELAVATNLMADKVTEQLFGRGDHRGEDGKIIRELMHNVITEFLKENPKMTMDDMLKHKGYESLVTSIAAEIKNTKTKYTTAGYLLGGVYLPNEVSLDEALTNKLKSKMNNALGHYKLDDTEKDFINKLSSNIGIKMFGKGASTARSKDTELVKEALISTFYSIKAGHEPESTIDLNPFIEGKLFNKMLTKALTELFKSNSTYTKAGLISGGIYLEEKKIYNKDFTKQVTSLMAEYLNYPEKPSHKKPFPESKKDEPVPKVISRVVTTLESSVNNPVKFAEEALKGSNSRALSKSTSSNMQFSSVTDPATSAVKIRVNRTPETKGGRSL